MTIRGKGLSLQLLRTQTEHVAWSQACRIKMHKLEPLHLQMPDNLIEMFVGDWPYIVEDQDTGKRLVPAGKHCCDFLLDQINRHTWRGITC